MLQIQNLQISINEKSIVKGISLAVAPGEVHAIMGPNGSGKSTLAYALAGHPSYQIQSSKLKIQNSKQKKNQETVENNKKPLTTNHRSQVLLDEKDLLSLSPDQRAKAGLFLAFQYPVAVDGVTVSSFLRQAYMALHPEDRLPLFKFREKLKHFADELGVKEEFLGRYLNEGFSGGEKKRIEILQMRVLKPKYAICDETDSGLDIDALKTVAAGIRRSVEDYQMGCVIITHYQRILKYVKPDKVHVMVAGRIVASGGEELVKQLEEEGYKQFLSV